MRLLRQALHPEGRPGGQRRVSRRACCAAAALLALAASPAAALPRDRTCRPIQALTATDGKAFADLRLQLVPEAGVRIRAGNGEARLAPASRCEVEGGDEGTVTCYWELEAFAEATAIYESLLGELRRCTLEPLPQEPGRSSDSITVLRRNAGEVRLGRAMAQIETELLEFSSGYHWVKLEAEYDPEGAADLLEDEQWGD